MVSNMGDEAEIGGEKSNHSLKVTGVSHMFEAGVPERIIQSQTGLLFIKCPKNTRESY